MVTANGARAPAKLTKSTPFVNNSGNVVRERTGLIYTEGGPVLFLERTCPFMEECAKYTDLIACSLLWCKVAFHTSAVRVNRISPRMK